MDFRYKKLSDAVRRAAKAETRAMRMEWRARCAREKAEKLKRDLQTATINFQECGHC